MQKVSLLPIHAAWPLVRGFLYNCFQLRRKLEHYFFPFAVASFWIVRCFFTAIAEGNSTCWLNLAPRENSSDNYYCQFTGPKFWLNQHLKPHVAIIGVQSENILHHFFFLLTGKMFTVHEVCTFIIQHLVFLNTVCNVAHYKWRKSLHFLKFYVN